MFKIGNRFYQSKIGELPTREGVNPYRKRDFFEIEEITIHHSGSDTALLDPWVLAKEMVTHQDPYRTKYPEIPYHIVIERSGKVVVCLPLDTLSWHADGGEPRDGVGINNWRGIAICLIGDFTYHPPTDAQLKSLKELCAEIDYQMGQVLRKVRHSDVQNTLCPGETSRTSGGWFDQLFQDVDLKEENAQLKAAMTKLLTNNAEAKLLIEAALKKL